MGTCKWSTEEVPLRPKSALVFHDAVFYYPSEQTADDDDDDDSSRRLAHVFSESRVPTPIATVCSSSDDRLPLKEVVSMPPSVGNDMPMIAGSAGSRRQQSMLRRMRAFFARSSSSSCNTQTCNEEMLRAGRQLSAVDASSTTPVVCTELNETPSVPTAVALVGVEDPDAACPARSNTLPPTCYFDSGESKTELGTVTAAATKAAAEPGTESVGGSLLSEAAAGEQPCDIKNNDEQLMQSCKQTISDIKP